MMPVYKSCIKQRSAVVFNHHKRLLTPVICSVDNAMIIKAKSKGLSWWQPSDTKHRLVLAVHLYRITEGSVKLTDNLSFIKGVRYRQPFATVN